MLQRGGVRRVFSDGGPRRGMEVEAADSTREKGCTEDAHMRVWPRDPSQVG